MGSDDQDLNQQINNLHNRIVAGDITAPAELTELILPILTHRLSKKFPLLFDPDLIDFAATDAILNYLANPNPFQPEKRSLAGYLFMSAKGDLLNYLDSRKLDQNSIDLAEDVEHLGIYSEDSIEGSLTVEEESFSRLSPMTSQIEGLLPNPIDRELVAMMMSGIRETQEYARVLGIDHLSLAEQKKIVKNHKDRIKKTITRNIDPKGLRNDY